MSLNCSKQIRCRHIFPMCLALFSRIVYNMYVIHPLIEQCDAHFAAIHCIPFLLLQANKVPALILRRITFGFIIFLLRLFIWIVRLPLLCFKKLEPITTRCAWALGLLNTHSGLVVSHPLTANNKQILRICINFHLVQGPTTFPAYVVYLVGGLPTKFCHGEK